MYEINSVALMVPANIYHTLTAIGDKEYRCRHMFMVRWPSSVYFSQARQKPEHRKYKSIYL